jgi:hypothetical protein
MPKLRKSQDFSSDSTKLLGYLRKPWREPTSTSVETQLVITGARFLHHHQQLSLSLSLPENERGPSIYNPHAQSSSTATMALRSAAIYEYSLANIEIQPATDLNDDIQL